MTSDELNRHTVACLAKGHAFAMLEHADQLATLQGRITKLRDENAELRARLAAATATPSVVAAGS